MPHYQKSSCTLAWAFQCGIRGCQKTQPCMWPDFDLPGGSGSNNGAQQVEALAQLLSQLCGALLLSALDRGQAAAANAPPHSELKEVGDAVDLGGHPWLQFAQTFHSARSHRGPVHQAGTNGPSAPCRPATLPMT